MGANMDVAGGRFVRGWLGRAVCALLLGLLGRPAADALPTAYNFVVAQDGSADFTSVQAAFDAAPAQSEDVTTIYVRAGTYAEKLTLDPTKWNVELVGEDAAGTVLTWNDYGGEPDTASYVDGVSSTASVYIGARNFTARNLTFANTAGAGSQATALAAAGNRGRFFDCCFLGYQDTLLTTNKKQYFKRCFIEGVTDFIYGDATAVFSHCTICCDEAGFITAAATPPTSDYGYVFRYCTITGSAPAGSVYLGRPWGESAKVVFFRCDFDALVIPAGWSDSDGASSGGGVFYAEYETTGDGADPDDRVDWSFQLDDDEAAGYTLKEIFGVEDGGLLHVDLTRKPWYNEGL